MTILTLPLIQEGQLSVTGESTGKLHRRLAQEQCGYVTDRTRNDLKCVEGPLNNNKILYLLVLLPLYICSSTSFLDR